jgi:sulfhydrogenase subunit beta (sulfur reductase)
MSATDFAEKSKFVFQTNQLQPLIDYLHHRGYVTVGPTIHDCAVVYDPINTVDQLPLGVADEQEAGFYRVKKRKEAGFFSYVVGAHTWKKFLYPPRFTLWKAQSQNGEVSISANGNGATPHYAFLGIRPCELQAIAIQDKVFLSGTYIDPEYKARREALALIAVNCAHPGGTCFCVSMNTGPAAEQGFDLALTEIHDTNHHYFVATTGSKLGVEIAKSLELKPAGQSEIDEESGVLKRAAAKMGRKLDTSHIKELLQRNDEHVRWNDVGNRCLNCANCTMVCPTCFCMTVEDTTDLTGTAAERVRRWDSCFTIDFSYIHGGAVRTSAVARYRQWMTHKLASWQDQFGTSGCVGCGRCITWCPVGIDITEEAAAIRATTKGE